MEKVYGFPSVMPLAADFVFYSNEDYGFNANLVAATNDVEAFALPYPATLDLFDETIVVHAMEFIQQTGAGPQAGTTTESLIVHLSMLDREFGASWFGTLSDADDEAMKAQFAGPMFFGQALLNVTGAASIEGTERHLDSFITAVYFPPVPLDLVTPLFIQFTNQARNITLLTNAVAEGNYDNFENTGIRVWFTRRNLTSAEKATRNMAIRFQRLDS